MPIHFKETIGIPLTSLTNELYCHGWCKVMDILKRDGHLLFGDTEIR